MGAAHGGKFHQGTRGGVGRDAAERERREARFHMLRTLAAHLRLLVPEAPVFVGGTPQLVSEAVAAIEAAGVTSVVEAPSLGARARVSEIARAVREGLLALRYAADEVLVDDVVRRFAADDLGATGAAVTGRALDDHAVKALVLSDTFVTTQPDVAEVFVRAALAQHAAVTVVSGDAAQRLEEAGGVGVLLRFSPFRSLLVTDGQLAGV
jgi:stalled ribosome rescue protein Dom34